MSSEKLERIIIPQGSFIIINNDETPPTEIISPGVQSCILVILHSSKGVALAHIDTQSPRSGSDTIHQMINKLKEINAHSKDQTITAKLIGGDFGFPCVGSSKILHSITDALCSENISYSHPIQNKNNFSRKHYCIFILASVLSIPFSPTAMVAATAMSVLAVTGYNYAQGSTYNVYVNTHSQKVRVVKTDPKEVDQILVEVMTHAPNFFGIVKKRYQGYGDQHLILAPPTMERM